MLKQKVVLKNNDQTIIVDRTNYDKASVGRLNPVRMQKYFHGIDFDTIYDYAFLIEKGEISDEFLSRKFGVTSKELELLKLYILHCVYTNYRKDSLHKCWNSCFKGFPSKCDKIRDLNKKDITDYPYILKGFQVYSDTELERFVVLECSHYTEDPKKHHYATAYMYEERTDVTVQEIEDDIDLVKNTESGAKVRKRD